MGKIRDETHMDVNWRVESKCDMSDPQIPELANPMELVESLLDLKANGCLLLKHPTYI